MGMQIVDALIVTLGLDGSKFNKEAKKSTEEMRKMGSDASRNAKLMEAKGKQAAQFYSQIRNEALSLLAVFTGGRALKNFAEETINSAAHLGQMADNLQLSTERLSAWQRAAERAGGSAEGITNQLQESQAAATKHSMGMFDESMQWFYRMGGSDKALKDGNTYLLARADIIAKIYKTDPGKAKLVAQSMGISPEQFNLIKQGSSGILSLVAAQEKNSAVTRAGAQQAMDLRNKMLDLRDKLNLTATTVLLRLAPALERGAAQLEKWAEWIAEHKDDISRWVDSAVTAIQEFISVLDKGAQAVGGWKNVLIALAALKVLSMVASVLSLASALGGVGTALGAISGAGAATGVLAAIGSAAGTAALAVAALGVATYGMSKALEAMDGDGTDALNHPGKRRVRRRGHADEWVEDKTLPQEHAGEHFQRAGRGGAWVKDEAPKTPEQKAADEKSTVPDWLQKFFGGKDVATAPTGRSRGYSTRRGAPAPVVAKPVQPNAPGAASVPAVLPNDVTAPQRDADDKAKRDKAALDVTKKLMAMGWTQQQAAGITGSLQQESGLDPAARNPKSGAYGIGQWLGSRVGDFKKFSGKDLMGSSLDEQLKFQQYELTKGDERGAGDKLRASKTAAEAARIHSESYERPGDDEANISRRQLNAGTILRAIQASNAAQAAALPQQVANSTTHNETDNRKHTSTSTSETNFNGPITIQTQAKDAEGIAKTFKQEMSKFGFVAQANTGMV